MDVLSSQAIAEGIGIAQLTSHSAIYRTQAMQLPRLIFADLNALNRDACASIQRHASATFPLNAQKLATLLSQGDQDARFLWGLYDTLPEEDVEKYVAAGWNMVADLLDSLPDVLHDCMNGSRRREYARTLVIAGGEELLPGALKNCLENYLSSGAWHVEFYCFRETAGLAATALHAKYPTRFRSFYLGKHAEDFMSEHSSEGSRTQGPNEHHLTRLTRLRQQILQLRTCFNEEMDSIEEGAQEITNEYDEVVQQNEALLSDQQQLLHRQRSLEAALKRKEALDVLCAIVGLFYLVILYFFVQWLRG